MCNFFLRRTPFPKSKNNAVRGISYDVNRTVVMASVLMGCSRETLVKFASAFDMPPPSLRDSWNKHLSVRDSSLTGVRSYAVMKIVKPKHEYFRYLVSLLVQLLQMIVPRRVPEQKCGQFPCFL